MDQETQQYLDVASKGLDVARKSGLLKNMFSRRPSNQPEHPAQPIQEMDYREEALTALRENAVETLAGLSLTVAEAAQILESDFVLDDLDKVNSTWQRHWTEGASKVGIDDEERRTWWANLLAGEIQQPETYSLRTLAVMDTLSTREAILFRKVCDYVWNPQDPVLILPPDSSALWKPEFSEGALLESASLAKLDGVAGFDWATLGDVVGPPLPLRMTFNNDSYSVGTSESKQVKLRCGKLSLTNIGQEMYRLTTPDYSQNYRDEILDEWRRSYTVRPFRDF